MQIILSFERIARKASYRMFWRSASPSGALSETLDSVYEACDTQVYVSTGSV